MAILAGLPIPIRISTCKAQGIVGMNQFMTINAFLLGLAQIIFGYNFVHSIFLGPKASENPWHANTLEWATSSPPAHYNFADPDGLSRAL